MREFFLHKWQSLVFRLLFYFMLALLALAVVLALSFSQRIRPHVQQQILPNVDRYLEYLVDDIGNPPDLVVARELADQLPFEIRIEGQGVEWVSAEGIGPIASYRFRAAPAPYDSIYYSHRRHKELVMIERHGLQYLFVVEDGFRRGSERRHWLLFVALGSILLLLYVGIRRLFRPIGALSEQVRKIGEGDLDQSLDEVGRGELGRLAAGVNRMSAQIRAMLENKSGLLLAISHELRSPLTRMRVNLELLEDSEQKRQLIEDTNEMENLLASILEAEKLNAGHAPLNRAPCRVDRLVDEFVARHPQGERIRCSLEAVEANIDATRFRLVLRNLVGNALQYSAHQAEPVEIHLSRDSGQLELAVIDHGIGIADEEITRLGEAFYRPGSARDRNTGGYGLGLYLCRLVSDLHGGNLDIESTPGQGTRVTLSLPLDNS